MPRPPGIGQAELEILHYIQDRHADQGPLTVRQVADHVAATKGHTRTTVLNVMTRLVQKGYLTRHKPPGDAAKGGKGGGKGAVYTYSPRQAKPELLRSLVNDFVSRALGGSLSPFVAYLAHDARLTDQDLSDLRQLVQTLESRPTPPEPQQPKGGAQ